VAVDAVISIGSQSFLDGLLRILGPALDTIRGPVPIAIPGLTNSLLNIRDIVPVLPGSSRGQIELRLQVELSGEVLLVASVAAGTVSLGLGTGDIRLDPATGTVDQPLRSGTLNINAVTGRVGPTVLSLDPATGTLSLPAAAAAPLNLGAIVGTLTLPAGGGDLGLPLPAVVAVPIDLTHGNRIAATVQLAVTVNGAAVDTEVAIAATTGFGLVFGANAASVTLPPLAETFTDGIRTALSSAIDRIVTQLIGTASIVQPTRDLEAVATSLAAAIPGVLNATLTDLFTALLARTGRLVFAPPGAGASCDVRALPTDAKTRLTIAADGSLILQVGFDRLAIAAGDPFPAFAPSTTLDANVTISNAFLRDLLCCLLEKLPNLALPPGSPAIVTSGTSNCCRWTGITLNLGVLALRGNLDACIDGAAGAPKTLSLNFDLRQTVSAPFVGEAVVVRIQFTLPIAVDLNDLTALTSLRLSAAPTVPTFEVRAGGGLTAWLVGLGLGSFFVPGLGVLITIAPHVILGIVSGFLRNTLDLILSQARLLQSPAAIPFGVLDAFGKFVPAAVTIDDLSSPGVLATPSSPWAVLPLFQIKRRRRRTSVTHALDFDDGTPD
jgi:hypothetical protein